MSKQTNKVDWAIWASFLVVVGATAGAIGVYYNHFVRNLGRNLSENVDAWAQFGDYFGGLLNPVIAFVAFLWLVHSVKLQQEELRKMNTEIEATRKLQEKQDARAGEAARLAGLSNLIEAMQSNIRACQEEIRDILRGNIVREDSTEHLSRLQRQIQRDDEILHRALREQKALVLAYLG